MISKPESGNVLFIILIAVALFGALNFVVGNMLRGGNPQAISEQKASILANEALDYARVIRQTIQTLKISNGCKDTDISFENSTEAGYVNTNAPADQSCHIFAPAGGNLNWISAPEEIADGTDYVFEFRVVTNIGDTSTGESELILGLLNVQYGICKALNNLLHGYDGEPYTQANVAGFGAQKFQGTYGLGPHINAGPLHGKRAACFGDNTTKTYYFYSVLIPR